MSLYLTPRGNSMAVAICARCGFKHYHDDLVQDPNTKIWVCKSCCDEKDPWRGPQRRTEDITLRHPRPDEELEA